MKKTLTNLLKAYIGESIARNRYSFYAKIAKKEGYEKLSEIFLLTAENEREHAKWLLKMINEIIEKENLDQSVLNVDSIEVPITLKTTLENLKSSIVGETYEFSEMYPKFAEIAEQEGYLNIANRLNAISIAEKHHKERFESILKLLTENKLFEKDTPVDWVCMKCGYIHKGNKPPEKCPSCEHPLNYFEVKNENF